MQAQVKDELQELQPTDSASQKSVTDWLMHVISGKQQPAEERLRAVTQETAQPDSIFALDPPPPPKEMNGAAAEPWTGAFTAEDLCGAPVIPMPPRVEKAAPETDEITANDVCWVPEERRLKPQPIVAQAPPQASAVMDLDITREPAPRFARETATPVAEEQEITAADISRQWVIDEMEQAAAATAPPEPEPEPEPEQVYVPQLVSLPVREEIAAPEPIATVAAEPEIVPEPMATPADNPFATPADIPFAASADTAMETEPEPTPVEPMPVLESAVAAEVEVAQAEPEMVVGEVEGKATETAAADEIEMPEFSSNSAMDRAGEAHATVAETPASADAKVWAKGGYWEGMHPAVDGTEQPFIEGKVGEAKIGEGEIEKAPGTAQQNASRGYFGSYLAPEDLEEIEKAKPEGWSQSWRTLIRLGAALPWLSRALPALEPGLGNHPGAAAGPGMPQGPVPGTTSEDVAGMRLVQYEIRSTVQDHSTHLKRMEEQLARVRESVESKSADRELAEDVQSAMKLLKIVGIGLGGLLVILIVLALVMVMKH